MLAWQWVKKTYPDLLIFHVPSGEPRDVVVAMKLKRMGVVPGVADFLMFLPGHGIAIEMKDDGGRQSDPQKRFQKQWELCGNKYHIVQSLGEFKAIVLVYMDHVWPWLRQSEPTNLL
jgi:cobalamin biosynthesis Co2+ chelatase CbiK